jgi:hypothetical protein
LPPLVIILPAFCSSVSYLHIESELFEVSLLGGKTFPIYTFHSPTVCQFNLNVSAAVVKTSPHVSHCVLDFRLLSHTLHITCIKLSPSTPGPGFCSTLPVTKCTTKTAAHSHVFTK